ncbi:helix-turn-helix domain-containing protein [Bacillus sp. AFS017336]|uniref:helix-turn-helix domain-containing protein n=1 Tax=Bacillus sp. AFS017336 TaxID=2033489 RepID=UPI0015CF3F09|nr:helix-turn-helix domain-containing protein [Bacillus sp. AFS017336]
MSTMTLKLTEEQLEQAIHEQDVVRYEKESLFLMNNLAVSMSEVYDDILRYVMPKKVKFNLGPDLIKKEESITLLKEMMEISTKIHEEKMDFNNVKIKFDTWFYQITSEGILVFDYDLRELMTITQASKELGVSRQMVYKYIERGLEAVGEKGQQKIPKHAIEAWKNPVMAFQIQWNYQMKRIRTQTIDERIEMINELIYEYEEQFGDNFYKLFGSYTDEDIDRSSESVDIFDWKELEEEKRNLLMKRKGGKE